MPRGQKYKVAPDSSSPPPSHSNVAETAMGAEIHKARHDAEVARFEYDAAVASGKRPPTRDGGYMDMGASRLANPESPYLQVGIGQGHYMTAEAARSASHYAAPGQGAAGYGVPQRSANEYHDPNGQANQPHYSELPRGAALGSSVHRNPVYAAGKGGVAPPSYVKPPEYTVPSRFVPVSDKDKGAYVDVNGVARSIDLGYGRLGGETDVEYLDTVGFKGSNGSMNSLDDNYINVHGASNPASASGSTFGSPQTLRKVTFGSTTFKFIPGNDSNGEEDDGTLEDKPINVAADELDLYGELPGQRGGHYGGPAGKQPAEYGAVGHRGSSVHANSIYGSNPLSQFGTVSDHQRLQADAPYSHLAVTFQAGNPSSLPGYAHLHQDKRKHDYEAVELLDLNASPRIGEEFKNPLHQELHAQAVNETVLEMDSSGGYASPTPPGGRQSKPPVENSPVYAEVRRLKKNVLGFGPFTNKQLLGLGGLAILGGGAGAMYAYRCSLNIVNCNPGVVGSGTENYTIPGESNATSTIFPTLNPGGGNGTTVNATAITPTGSTNVTTSPTTTATETVTLPTPGGNTTSTTTTTTTTTTIQTSTSVTELTTTTSTTTTTTGTVTTTTTTTTTTFTSFGTTPASTTPTTTLTTSPTTTTSTTPATTTTTSTSTLTTQSTTTLPGTTTTATTTTTTTTRTTTQRTTRSQASTL